MFLRPLQFRDSFLIYSYHVFLSFCSSYDSSTNVLNEKSFFNMTFFEKLYPSVQMKVYKYNNLEDDEMAYDLWRILLPQI